MRSILFTALVWIGELVNLDKFRNVEPWGANRISWKGLIID